MSANFQQVPFRPSILKVCKHAGEQWRLLSRLLQASSGLSPQKLKAVSLCLPFTRVNTDLQRGNKQNSWSWFKLKCLANAPNYEAEYILKRETRSGTLKVTFIKQWVNHSQMRLSPKFQPALIRSESGSAVPISDFQTGFIWCVASLLPRIRQHFKPALFDLSGNWIIIRFVKAEPFAPALLHLYTGSDGSKCVWPVLTGSYLSVWISIESEAARLDTDTLWQIYVLGTWV